jgi:Tfp pilus assembly protein PilF
VHLEQAVAIDATDGLCHLVLAMVCDEIADVPRAILHYEKALELDATIAGDGVTPGRLEELKR